MRANGQSREACKVLNVSVRPEVRNMLFELCEKYHLSQSAIVAMALVELHGARLTPPTPERKKRGNGHP